MRRGRRPMFLGLSEVLWLSVIMIVVASAIAYHFLGMGAPPSVELRLVARGDTVVLRVIEGEIPAGDWEYILFDEGVNPPFVWTPGPRDMTSGADIVLRSNLPPATYRVQIRHIATEELLLDDRVTVS